MLGTVAQTVGIDVKYDKLHGDEYDIGLTYQVYYILTGLEIEL